MNNKDKLVELLNYVADNISQFPTDGFISALANYLIDNDMVSVVRCKDCKFQIKIWHKDKRTKDGGYWLYFCDRNEDQFVCHAVNGYDDDFCSYGERKENE